MPSLMTAAEVAARLAISRRTIVRLAITGRLPYAHKLPGATGAYLFDPGVIELYGRSGE